MARRDTVNDFDEDEPDGKADEPEDESYGVYRLRTPSGRHISVTIEPTVDGKVFATCEKYEDFFVEGSTVQEVLEEARSVLVDYESEGR